MRSIFVTGGAGFIGSQFVRQSIAANEVDVIVLDALTYAGSLANLVEVADSARLHFYQGSINDRALVTRLLDEHQCIAVINFAAETHVDRSIGSPGDFVRTNVMGTFELLDASLRYYEKLSPEDKSRFRFLHVSTDEVYGQLGETGYFTEDTAYAPSSPYSASKASSDHFVRAYYHTYGLPTLITNCSNNYGPYQFPEKLIPLIIRKASSGEPLPVYGNGLNVRDWLHVEDHCRALQVVLDTGRIGETYNIGGDCELSNIEVVKRICEHVDRLCPHLGAPSSSLIRYVTDRPGHDFRYAIDHSKITRELGWKPQKTFETGIAETIQWYLSHTDWASEVMKTGAYSLERLGLRGDEPAKAPDDMTGPVVQEVFQEIEGVSIFPRKFFKDKRGWLIELFRNDELESEIHPQMAYISETLPGVTRGPHEHVDQTDYFAFIGPGDFRLHLWDSRPGSPTEGNRMVCIMGESNPSAVTIPPGVVHAYKNISDKPGHVFNAPNQLFAGHGKKGPIDEIRHEDVENSPYVVL
jgi:dTDP-glucose 4,6-dehydratase